MRRNILSLILIISLLLNVFFVGGYMFAQFRTRGLAHQPQRIQAVVKQLDLTPSQKQLFRQLKTEATGLRKSYRKQMASLRKRLWKTLASDSPDRSQVTDVIHKMSILREDYQTEIAGIIEKFLNVLNREQKQRFLRITNNSRILGALISG